MVEKSKIKAYFIDLDGTLLDQHHNFGRRPSAKNLAAIEKIRKQGIEVVISTGRMGQNLADLAKIIGGNYFIQANGALITNKQKQVLYQSKITIKQILLLDQIFKKYQLAIKLDDQFVAYGVKSFLAKKISQKAGYKKRFDYHYNLHQEYFKVVVYGLLSRKKMEKIRLEIKAQVPNIEAVSTGHGFSLEITHQEASKGKAAAFVAKQLNLTKDQIAHIGDSMNDSTVRDYVGTLIAMKNSDQRLKNMANIIGPHYKNGGLANLFL